LAFCGFCGKEISDRAPVCPNCGHPQGAAAQAAAGGGVAMGGRRTEGNAIASLILGIAAFVVCPLIPAILAVIFGNKAKQNIAADPSLEGEGLAKAGVILGWINIGLAAAVALLLVILIFVGSSTPTNL
jgi:hypothetical protein